MASSAKQAKKEFDRQMKMMRQQQDREHAWSEQQAQKQMDFQERMSSSAHQREMQDLRAAGLNPVLAAGSGGASTPAGSEPSYSSSIVDAMPQMFATLNNAISAAKQASAHSARVAGRVVDKSFTHPTSVYDPDSKGYVKGKKDPENQKSIAERINPTREIPPFYELENPSPQLQEERGEFQAAWQAFREDYSRRAQQLLEDLGQLRVSIGANSRYGNVNWRAGVTGTMKQLGTIYQDLLFLQLNTYGHAGRMIGTITRSLGRNIGAVRRAASSSAVRREYNKILNDIEYARFLMGK